MTRVTNKPPGGTLADRADTAWGDLPTALRGTALEPFGDSLRDLATERFAGLRHGDLSRWLAALGRLPRVPDRFEPARDAPVLGAEADDVEALRDTLMALHPWRKGPLTLGGVRIDSEWRSDWKWNRLAPHLSLQGQTVLDVGGGNGYFGWRMLGAGARVVIGIDPTTLFILQWMAQRHFAPGRPNYALPLADDELPMGLTGFDTVFTMGVLYHRRDPGEHLGRMRGLLRPGGRLVLETLVVEHPGAFRLVPEGRYARMRNVWYIPSPKALKRDLETAGFRKVRLIDRSVTTVEEQRSTPWMRFESLANCLDPDDASRTVEGHPAPLRAIVIAR